VTLAASVAGFTGAVYILKPWGQNRHWMPRHDRKGRVSSTAGIKKNCAAGRPTRGKKATKRKRRDPEK